MNYWCDTEMQLEEFVIWKEEFNRPWESHGRKLQVVHKFKPSNDSCYDPVMESNYMDNLS